MHVRQKPEADGLDRAKSRGRASQPLLQEPPSPVATSESELGRGGHGVVFGAEPRHRRGSPDQMLSARPRRRRALVREAAARREDRERARGKVHDVALHEGAPHVVMDHLEGGCRRRGCDG